MRKFLSRAIPAICPSALQVIPCQSQTGRTGLNQPVSFQPLIDGAMAVNADCKKDWKEMTEPISYSYRL
jgi:hypothetical protein